MRVLICVTHLLGTGHLSRALTLGRAFARQGHSVDLVSGGGGVANLDYSDVSLHQLPPVKSDGVNFTDLLDAENRPVNQEYLQDRVDILCRILRDTAPDVLITELFPFGRRILAAEFTAMLKTAHSLPRRPRVFCSIRDILAPPSKPEKVAQTGQRITQYYDAVLVHSDPEQTPLETSWPVTPALSAKLAYTGYVAPPVPDAHPLGTGAGEVLVTAGGGSVGEALFTVAVEAAKLDDRPWRLLVGGADAAQQISRLQALAGAHTIIEPTRPDFRQMLHHAAAAVAMCGYNTAMDLLQTGTPAVFVPFDAGGEVEQGLRAQSLARHSQFAVVKTADLTPEALLAGLSKVVRHDPPSRNHFDGANEAVRIVTRVLESSID